MALDMDDDITFGLELEMICTYHIPQGTYSYDDECDEPGKLVRDAVIDRMLSIGVLVAENNRSLDTTDGQMDYSSWNVEPEASIFFQAGPTVEQLWNLPEVIFPNTLVWEVETPCGERYGFADVEIITPVFSARCDDWLEQIERVLAAVTSGDFRSTVNKSCGFHIHVGRGKAGYTLEEAQKIAAVTTVLEHQIDVLHPSHRVWGAGSVVDSLMRSARLSPSFTPVATAESIFHSIMRTKSPKELVLLLQHDPMWGLVKYFKVNFLPLWREGGPTIEFRQHAGTLKIGEIKSWVHFVLMLVCGAARTPGNELWEALAAKPSSPPLPGMGLLKHFIQDEGLRLHYEAVVGRNLELSEMAG